MLTSSDRIPVAGAAGEAHTLAGLLETWAERQGDQIALTYLDHRASPDGLAVSLTWADLATRVRDTAAWLRQRVEPGERAAVLVRQGPDYVVGFLAALRAGLVAVPLFAPDLPGHGERLMAVLDDAEPAVVLTTREHLPQVRSLLERLPGGGPRAVAIDTIGPAGADGGEPADRRPDDVAYLQYTSGSTRTPAGVMITHANVLASARQAAAAYGAEHGDTVAVSWLPLFHDMGLVLGIAAPVLVGMRTVLMDPVAFLEQPVRWLRALSTFPGAISAAPNFAYGYCAGRVSERDKAMLRLDRVVSLIDGSEPIRPELVARFTEAFAECGLRPHTHRPSYGLAEATVLVTASPLGTLPVRATFYRAQLAMGEAVPAAPGEESTVTLVSSGRPAGQCVRVVHPETCAEQPEGTVGEIWVSGPNVGRGYWRRPDASAVVFCALLTGGGDDDPRWWLRTGDLGVLADGELYVTGRIKDLIIVDGRNHYPQDVEATVEGAHPAIRPHVVAAFAAPGADGDRVVVAAERSRWVIEGELDLEEVVSAVRRSVAREHGLALRDVLLLEPGEVPRTTSGKVSRSACRARYLSGAFAGSPAR